MRVSSWICGAILVVAMAGAPIAAEAQSVSAVVRIDTGGDLPGFLELFKEATAINQKQNHKGQSRVFQQTVGENVNAIVIVVEYPDLATWAKETTENGASAEWQALIEKFQGKGMSVTSSSLVEDITP